MALTAYPLLGAIAAKLTRSGTIRLLDDQLIYKPSNTRDASTTVTAGTRIGPLLVDLQLGQADDRVDSASFRAGDAEPAHRHGREPSLAGFARCALF